ncbi:hypothetical protein K1719_011841 [Acacia pycnantha]|nr:hypothetical protein K1719_011841 [Acacia pycnantha]
MQDKNALRVVEVLEQSTQRTMTVRGKAKGKTETAGKNNSAYQGGQEVVGTKSSVPIEKRRVDKRSREAVVSKNNESMEVEGSICETTQVEAQNMNVELNLAPGQDSAQKTAIGTTVPFDPGVDGLPLNPIEATFFNPRNLQLLCKESKPSLIILAETRTSDVSKFNCFRRLGYDSFRIIPSSGQSGGLAIGWMSSQINVSVVEEDRQFFHLSCQIPKIDPFFITAVYPIPYANYEAALWECLSRIYQDRINKCRLLRYGSSWTEDDLERTTVSWLFKVL